MRKLNKNEIEDLAYRNGVRSIAVENFLISMTDKGGVELARANLFLNTQMYRWNNKTVKAISDGIKLASE